MNIFKLDESPFLAATYHIDAHVNKMITEYAQILSTAQNECEGPSAGKVYKSFNPNHPSCKWVMEGYDNYVWLHNLWSALARERRYRWNKTHASYEKLSGALSVPPNLPEGSTPLRLAMPSQYWRESPVEAYRLYYVSDKQYDSNGKWMFKWTRRGQPSWVLREDIR